ncbi:MAG: glutamine synthetase III [Clostridia bacterium]|nr:glutamine synthetase III [Clostridia bacterium]
MNEIADKLMTSYASAVFNETAMRKYLPGETYKQLKKTIDNGKPLDPALADIVANGLKRWALDQGATHYTHWFQPMTGFTAEKHDSFINPLPDGGIIMSFSGKELVRGESDASSFPSGGLRATFEARGYTIWDCTSPAFVKDETLYIPTCFSSFTGEALDMKTPLLRSMEVINTQSMRIVRAFGDNDTKRVVAMAGAEQEYFLVDKKLASKRLDLITCGRTLFGARPAKGQELDDHYYGNIKDRVMAFMREVDNELWRLGVPAKTEHNEAAPAQHELANVYSSANIACDQNQLVMETLKKVALRRDMICLLHEKPFEGVNGSGKHNNWSINAVNSDGTKSLLDQGKTPVTNARFLLLLAAVIWAVDEYAGLLRVSVASPSNDCRLGGNEAPPCIMSIFLGDMLTDVLCEIATGGASNIREGGNMQLGVTTMPNLPKDVSDRNRTSPFAFTGKKFEFRMQGSSSSIAECNTVINTIVAETLSKMADRLEKADDIFRETNAIISDVMREHKRIIFNGNNYSDEWRKEAKERGLQDIPDAVTAAAELIKPAAVELFEKYGIYTRKELEARYEIRLESYIKHCKIEAETMLEMCNRQILPAVIAFASFLAKSIVDMRDTAIALDISAPAAILKDVSAATAGLKNAGQKLAKALKSAQNAGDNISKATAYRDKVLPIMAEMREYADKLESCVDEKSWPFPTYNALLFGVE